MVPLALRVGLDVLEEVHALDEEQRHLLGDEEGRACRAVQRTLSASLVALRDLSFRISSDRSLCDDRRWLVRFRSVALFAPSVSAPWLTPVSCNRARCAASSPRQMSGTLLGRRRRRNAKAVRNCGRHFCHGGRLTCRDTRPDLFSQQRRRRDRDASAGRASQPQGRWRYRHPEAKFVLWARVAPDDAGNAPQVGQLPLRGGSTVTKKDDVARSEKIEADRTQEIWDDDGGRAPRPDENGAAESSPQPASPPSRRVGERRRGDRGR